MQALKIQLDPLVDRLARDLPATDSPEGRTLVYLKQIQALMASDGAPLELAAAFSDLKQFWLDSIAWCSALSRDIEKLIIIYGELSEGANPAQPPVE